MQLKTSVKHLQINKANNNMFIIVAVAAVVTMFSLVSAKALWAQSSYQRKALGEKNKAVEQLKSNLSAAQELKNQFDIFAKGDPNIIGGRGGLDVKDEDTLGPNDGRNSRIVLDALPSQYDFPALISSVEKMSKNKNITLQSVGGVDEGKDSLTTGAEASSGGGAIPMLFNVSTTTSYKNSAILVKDFERSIRPIDITKFSLNGSDDNIITDIQATTYYMPGISLKIEQKEVD